MLDPGVAVLATAAGIVTGDRTGLLYLSPAPKLVRPVDAPWLACRNKAEPLPLADDGGGAGAGVRAGPWPKEAVSEPDPQPAVNEPDWRLPD